MQFKKLLSKTLLVLVGLCIGTCVLAGEKSTIYSKALSGWSSDDLTANNSTFTAGKWTPSQTGDANKGLWTSTETGLMTRCRQNTVTGTLTLDRTANTIVTLDAVWNVGDAIEGGSHQNSYNQYSYFIYGDMEIGACLDNRSTDYYYIINGKKTTLSGTTAGSLLNTDLTIHLVVNSVSNAITEFYIKQGETELSKFSDLTEDNNSFAVASDYDKVITKAYSSSSKRNCLNYLKSLTVQQETQDVATATVTFHYVDTNDNDLSSIKADLAVPSIAVGTDISTLIVEAYTATFYNGTSNKYVYDNTYIVEGDYTTVQASGNTVTLKFTDYPSMDYNVKAQVNGVDLTTVASSTAYFDGSTTAYWSKYINVDDNWYVTDTYGLTITTASNNVAFTATSDVDYFFEVENQNVSSTYGAGYTGIGASNGRAVTLYAAGNVSTTSNVAAGVYTISLNCIKWADGYTDTYEIAYSTDDSNWIALGNIVFGGGEEGLKELAGAVIPATSKIRVRATMGSQTPRRYLDYIVLKKTSNLPSTENIVVSSAGYATYVSNYNLDFSSATTKAYKVKVDEKAVATLTPVSQVPAKTPVLLYVSGGNGEGEAIPVTSEAVAAVTGNDLVAGEGAEVATYETVVSENDYTNMILNNGTEGIGFYFANDKTVAANRAYLHIPTDMAPAASSARPMVINFEGMTGINSVKGEESMVNGSETYNLQGQRVAQPTKGLYIINGKKVMMK